MKLIIVYLKKPDFRSNYLTKYMILGEYCDRIYTVYTSYNSGIFYDTVEYQYFMKSRVMDILCITLKIYTGKTYIQFSNRNLKKLKIYF
jgi:hypothetical protein